jgi:FkbM family methyltransferase
MKDTPTWEADHFIFLKESKKNCLVSFGEWIGPIAMYWMHINKKHYVTAFEPDPLAFVHMYNNLKFYGKNVQLENMCVNENGGSVFFETSGLSVSRMTSDQGYKVNCISYERLYELKINDDCLFKIDVEGYEEYLIEHLIKFPPPELSFSYHPQNMKDSASFLEKLEILKKNYSTCRASEDVNPAVYCR